MAETDPWLVEQSSRLDKNVTVSNPETHSSFMSSYTSYGVSHIDGSEIVARRRFKEFESVHKALCNRYQDLGIWVPPLPKKKLIGKTSADFVNSRMRGLDRFVKLIEANPYLATDRSWLAFLDPNVQSKDFEADGGEAGTNEGEIHWIERLNGLDLPENFEETLDQLADQSNELYKYTKSSLESLRKLISVGESFATKWQEFGGHLCELGSIESHSNLITSEFPPTSDYITQSGLLANSQAALYNNFPHQFTVLIAEELENVQMELNELNYLLNFRTTMKSSINKTEAKLQKLESGGDLKVDQANATRDQLNEYVTLYHQFAKGFLHITLPELISTRAEKIKEIFANMGGLTLDMNLALNVSIKDFFKSTNFQPSDTHHHARTSLEALNMLSLNVSIDEINLFSANLHDGTQNHSIPPPPPGNLKEEDV